MYFLKILEISNIVHLFGKNPYLVLRMSKIDFIKYCRNVKYKSDEPEINWHLEKQIIYSPNHYFILTYNKEFV